MPNYNKNSVFAVSNAGTIPNRVDDLIFFEDVNRQQKLVWDEFERIMATGDYDAAHAYIMNYADIHGYFGDLYNMMVNRIKAVQNLLILNRTNIENGSGVFSSFTKPDIFVYQETESSPKTVAKDQVWIGPKGYFDASTTTDGINKLALTWPDGGVFAGGVTINQLESGYIKFSGEVTSSNPNHIAIIGSTRDDVVTGADVWSYWNYYVSGSVSNYRNGKFRFYWRGNDGQDNSVVVPCSRTANMHANLLNLPVVNTVKKYVLLQFEPTYGEVYEDLVVGFMICKTSETVPNQKFVRYGGE